MRGIVDVGTMFDRIHSGLRGPQNSLRAVRVRGDLASQAMRVSDDRLYLFQRVRRSLGIVSVGKHASGGADLDHVGAVFDDFTDFVLHAFHSVGDSEGRVREIRREHVLVAMASGDAEGRPAHQHARAREHLRR